MWERRSNAGIASLLTPPQNQREARREAHRQNEQKEEDSGEERKGRRERRVKERQIIYLTMWVCEVSRHASSLCIPLAADGRIAAGDNWSQTEF